MTGRTIALLLAGLFLTIVGALVWFLVQMAAHANELRPTLPTGSIPTASGRVTQGEGVTLPGDRRASRSRTSLAAGVNTRDPWVKDGHDGRTGALAVPAPAAHDPNVGGSL